MSWSDWLALVLLFLPVVDWAAVWVLGRVIRRFPRHASLRERRTVARAIAFVTTFFAFLALARLGHITLPNDFIATVLVALIVGLSMVNALFLVRYWRAAFQ